MDDTWDEASVAELLSLKSRGLTMRQIATAMKRSRNAVIGKLARIRNASFREGYHAPQAGRARSRIVTAPPHPNEAEEKAQPPKLLGPINSELFYVVVVDRANTASIVSAHRHIHSANHQMKRMGSAKAKFVFKGDGHWCGGRGFDLDRLQQHAAGVFSEPQVP